MNSVYDFGYAIDLKNLTDVAAVATGDNKTDIIEVGTNKIYKAGVTTSTDYRVDAGASGIIVILDKDVLKVDADSIEIQLMESDTTTATDFTLVDNEQVSVTLLQTKETGIEELKGNTTNPFINPISMFVKYNGFKDYYLLNIKGGASVGGGGMKSMLFMAHLDKQHGEIQWKPTNA